MANIKEILFKPKWQHKNARIRRKAVADSTDDRLVEALPDLARNDPSADVRLQAVRRLTDLYHLMRVAAEDESEAVREAAYRAYRAMLSGEHTHPVALEERLEILPRLDDPELIDYLAQHAEPPEVRREAVAKVRRQGLLGDIAIGDSDPGIRRLALSRVEQRSTLERVAEGVRKHDKALFHEVQERLSAGSGEPGSASAETAKSLCEQMEALSRSGALPDEKKGQAETLAAEWKKQPAELRKRYGRRFDGASRIVARILQAHAEAPGAESPELRALRIEFDGILEDAQQVLDKPNLRQVTPILERLKRLADPVQEKLGADASRRIEAALERVGQIRENLLAEQPVNPQILSACEAIESMDAERTSRRKLGSLQEQWDKAWKTVEHPSPNEEAVAERFQVRMAELEEALARQQEARESALEEIDARVGELEDRLDDGDLAAAARVQQGILDLTATIGRHPKLSDTDFKARLHTAKGRLHELREWQHWANNKIRKRLCEEAEGLLDAGLHPDAVIAKIKTLRSQWRELNDSEKLPGDNPRKLPAPGLYRRFQAACDRAFKPAKGFFEKRDEVRRAHLEELDELASRIEAAVEDPEQHDWKQLERLVRDGRGGLRRLNDIPPKKRGPMSRRLRDGAQTLDDYLEEHYQVVERRKQRIIDAVAALDPETDLDGAMEAAKEAQQHWQQAGLTRRNREQKLWKTFRAACDRIFDHLSEQQAKEKAEQQARQAAQEELLTELEKLEAQVEDDPQEARAELHRLQDRWRRQPLHDRRRERTFGDLVATIERKIGATLIAAEIRERQIFRDIVELCHQLEARWFDREVDADQVRDRIDRLRDGITLPDALDQRIETALGEPADDPADLADRNLETAEEICVALEILSGIETPEPYRQQRMDYQVARLSRRMSGEDTQSVDEEAAELEETWYACGPLDPDTAPAVSRRYRAAMDRIDAQRAEAGRL